MRHHGPSLQLYSGPLSTQVLFLTRTLLDWNFLTVFSIYRYGYRFGGPSMFAIILQKQMKDKHKNSSGHAQYRFFLGAGQSFYCVLCMCLTV